MESFSVCVECYYKKAELKFREEKAEKDGNLLRLERVPYYICPICREETYDLDVEVFVEKAIGNFMKSSESKTIDVGAIFCEKSPTEAKSKKAN